MFGGGPRVALLGVALLTALLSQAGSASARPAEVGDRCVAGDQEAGWTTIVLNNGLNDGLQEPFVQVGNAGGVVTRWRIEVGPGAGAHPQRLVVLRQAAENEDQRVGESALENVVEGVNEFAARIPAPAYAHVGLDSPDQTYTCKLEGHLGGVVDDPFAIGETRKFEVHINTGIPVQAFVEPDRDGDGYGDESQDSCPTLAWTHEACPTVSLSISKQKVTRRAIVAEVSFESDRALPAAAKIELGAEMATGETRKGKPAKGGLFSIQGSREMTAGSTAVVRFPLPKAVKRRLARLSPKKGIVATVRAKALNADELIGSGLQSAFAVKLRGRAKSAKGPS